jgi:hypothetical protein
VLNVTAETGSPIAETGIVEPSFAAEQSASVTTLSSPSEGKPDPGAWDDKAEALQLNREARMIANNTVFPGSILIVSLPFPFFPSLKFRGWFRLKCRVEDGLTRGSPKQPNNRKRLPQYW